MRDGPIVKKSLEFANIIVVYCDFLASQRRFVISNQLLRSATSIGANIFEAQYAESKLDFIHKMKIALKEAHETLFWIILCENMDQTTPDSYVQENQLSPGYIKKNLNEILAILSKIILTSKKNLMTD